MSAPAKSPTEVLSPFDLDLLRKHVEKGGRLSQGTAKLLLVTAESLLEALLTPSETR